MARRSLCRLAVALYAAWGAVGAYAAEPTDEEIIAAHLKAILTTFSAEDVAKNRDECITGSKADTVAMAREVGLPGFADASDLCVTVLIRTARDGRLLDAYERLIDENAGDPSRAATLPDAIGGALIKNSASQVPIGNGWALNIKPALAFDAGFSAAYPKGPIGAQAMPDGPTLKALAEDCLAQRSDNLALCFSTGYALAVRALNGDTPPIR